MKSANEIMDDDPIKATLFGKFYEKILLKWLENREGFKPWEGKPRVYWKDIEINRDDSDAAIDLNKELKNMKKNHQFCTPDGILTKSQKLFIWEAKNWPLWSEGKEPLEQLEDLLFSMPLLLAKKADYRTKKYSINGFLFSWWSKPKGVESLIREINSLIEPQTFEIYYTANIIEECISNKYYWYLKIINKEKKNIEVFFKDLLGE